MSCLKQSGPGSVRFGYGLGVERFDRFRFSVPAVPLKKGFSVFQYNLKERTVPVPVPVPGKRPDLTFLAFLDFLAFFVARNFLAFLSVFPFFPRDFRGSA